MAPELSYQALDIAIIRNNKNNARISFDLISAAATRGEIAALPPECDSILLCIYIDRDAGTKFSSVKFIDMVYRWDVGCALQYRLQLPTILNAICKDNYAEVEKLMQFDIVNGKSVLNSQARAIC